MRVLMLAPRLPYPADHGAAQRNLSLLRWLGARHEVTLLAFGNPNDARARAAVGAHAQHVEIVAPPARRLLDRVRTLAFSSTPDLARRLWSAELIQRLRECLTQQAPDVVQIEGLEMYAAVVAADGKNGRRLVVLDEHNAEYCLQESAYDASRRQGALIATAYSLLQARRLKRYERHACASVDGVIAVSPEDDFALRQLGTATPVTVIPNGVDLDSYAPSLHEREPASVLFIGKMDYRPNVDAAVWLGESIWPLVRAELPETRLAIVGRDPIAQVERLGRIEGISVEGAVPDDRVWFQRSTVLAVPMRMGGGVRLKVLQAMATGTPIVSTGIGMAGVGAVAETHYLRGDTAEEFARQLVRALRHGDFRRAVANNALGLARERFDWSVCLAGLDDFYQSLRRSR